MDLLRQTAREYLAKRGASGSLSGLAALDWIGLLVDEELSGAGWRPLESCVVAEELGRACDGSPWLGTVLAAAAVSGAPAEIRERWLPSLLSGEAVGGFVMAGRSVRIVAADEADLLIVAAPTGLRLIEQLAGQPRRPDPDSLDSTRSIWRVDISAATGTDIGDSARSTLMCAMGQLLVCADAIGAMAGALERLVTYLSSRIAFGAPIASFQAVRHRLVDLLVIVVKSRAVVAKAARALAEGADATALAATAHAFVVSKAVWLIDECMQLSGGIGFTWDYPLHHELRRVSADAWLMGTARDSRAHLAEVSGW